MNRKQILAYSLSLSVVLAQNVLASEPAVAQLLPPSLFIPPQASSAVPQAGQLANPAKIDQLKLSESNIIFQLAQDAERRGETNLAMRLYHDVLSITQSARTVTYESATSAGRLGALYAASDQFGLAIKHVQSALSQFKEIHGENCTDVAIELSNLSYIKERIGQFRSSEAGYKRALHILYASTGENDDVIGATENNYGDFLYRRHRLREAYQHYLKAQHHWSRCYGTDHQLTRMVERKMRDLYKQLNLLAG